MRILVLTSTFPRWPDDTEPAFVYQLCERLSNEHQIDVLAPHGRNTPTRERMGSVDVYRFRYFFGAGERLAYEGGILPNLKRNPQRFLLVPFFIAGELLLAVRLLRRKRYDAIHAHWVIPQGFVAVLARLFSRRRPPLLVTSHGGDLFALKGPLLGRLKHWIANRAEHFTVVSSAMRERALALGIPPGRVSVIPMGVDSLGVFLPPTAGAPRDGLVFVGRLVDKKGIEYLLRALPEVLARHPSAHLTVIGDGPLRGELRALCRELGITGAVTFTGAVVNRDIPRYLQSASIAIIPSVVTSDGDQEGAPVAIMETLACGCATIVSDYPGARDIIEDGVNGKLVTQRSASGIAAAVIGLLDDPEECRRLGSTGRSTVQQRFDWQVISQCFDSLLETIAQSPAGTAVD